jgi:hypothetical protein
MNYLYITDEKFVQLDRAAVVAVAAASVAVLRRTNSYGAGVQCWLQQQLERKARPRCRVAE